MNGSAAGMIFKGISKSSQKDAIVTSELVT